MSSSHSDGHTAPPPDANVRHAPGQVIKPDEATSERAEPRGYLGANATILRVILRRVLQMFPVALVVTFIVFSTTLLLPGDPTVAMLGEGSSAADRAVLRKDLGLDLPVPVQYVRWLGNVLQGNFGRSLLTGEPVVNMLARRAPVTIELALLAVAFATVIGIPAGIVAAVWRNSWIDIAASVISVCSLAIPYFWGGILLIMLFAVRLQWLPSGGTVGFFEDPLKNLQSMLLPMVALGAHFAALIMRQTRTSLLGVLASDYVRTARAKGVPEPRVVVRHALRNALLPVVTVIGLQIGILLGGAVVTETVFSLAGLGRMLIDGIFARDFPAIQGAILVLVFGILIVNLLTDLSYLVLDKRIAR